jgi:hypothetical protein
MTQAIALVAAQLLPEAVGFPGALSTFGAVRDWYPTSTRILMGIYATRLMIRCGGSFVTSVLRALAVSRRRATRRRSRDR